MQRNRRACNETVMEADYGYASWCPRPEMDARGVLLRSRRGAGKRTLGIRRRRGAGDARAEHETPAADRPIAPPSCTVRAKPSARRGPLVAVRRESRATSRGRTT